VSYGLYTIVMCQSTQLKTVVANTATRASACDSVVSTKRMCHDPAEEEEALCENQCEHDLHKTNQMVRDLLGAIISHSHKVHDRPHPDALQPGPAGAHARHRRRPLAAALRAGGAGVTIAVTTLRAPGGADRASGGGALGGLA